MIGKCCEVTFVSKASPICHYQAAPLPKSVVLYKINLVTGTQDKLKLRLVAEMEM